MDCWGFRHPGRQKFGLYLDVHQTAPKCTKVRPKRAGDDRRGGLDEAMRMTGFSAKYLAKVWSSAL
jgi:hypothetical protein